jgi:hypothetical protein
MCVIKRKNKLIYEKEREITDIYISGRAENRN